MPSSAEWLKYKVVEPKPDAPATGKPFFISIPKKSVKLASRRNRLKRLIREALRQDERFWGRSGHTWSFRVNADPGNIGLKDVQECLKKIF